MSQRRQLQVSGSKAKTQRRPEQERFDYLTRELATLRKQKAALEKSLAQFRQDRLETLGPLRTSLRSAWRETVLAMDRLLNQSGWSRIDREELREMLVNSISALLQERDDEELRAMFDRHSDVDFESSRRAQMERLKREAEEMTGFDLGEDGGLDSEDDLVQRLYERMEQARDQEDRHKQRASKRGSTAVGKQSLREIYRRLASAIHPDREHDPQRRAEKTELMQTINRAYAANDLLSLLELQLELLSEEVAHRQTGTQRLKEYNKLLSEQLSRLRAELQELQADFQMEYGLAPTGVLSGNTLRQQLKREARGLRGEIARQRELLQIFSTKTGARKWLRERRRLVRLDPGEDESGADSD